MPTVVLNKVRLAFFHGWRKSEDTRATDGSIMKGRFGGNGIFLPNSEAHGILQRAIFEAGQVLWKQNTQQVLDAIPRDKICLRNGNTQLMKDGSIRTGFAGMMFVAAYNSVAPAIAAHRLWIPPGKTQKVPVLIGEDGRGYVDGVDVTEQLPFQIIKPYAGCEVNMRVDVYAMDKTGRGKSVNCSLVGVQFQGHGDPFTGGGASAEGFGDVGDEDDITSSTMGGAGIPGGGFSDFGF